MWVTKGFDRPDTKADDIVEDFKRMKFPASYAREIPPCRFMPGTL